jgi:hypothetical protein
LPISDVPEAGPPLFSRLMGLKQPFLSYFRCASATSLAIQGVETEDLFTSR